jgi:hypothetical protein
VTLLSLLHHRLRAVVRAPFVGRRALSLILGGVLALYLGGGLVLVGLVFDDLVREVAPQADPLLVAARGLLPAGLAYAALQVFLASGLRIDPTPYRALPVRRGALVALLCVFALGSAWTAVPMAFVGAVGVEAALGGAGSAALRFGLAALGVLAAAASLAPMLRQAASTHPLASAGGALALVAATGIEAIDLGVGAASLVDLSGWLFGGMVRGALLPTLTAGLGLAGVVGGYARWVRRAMVLDRQQRRSVPIGPSSSVLDRWARRGPAWREAVLEGRLLLRNAQTRWTLVTALLVVALVAGLGLIPFEWADLRGAAPLQLLNMTLFPGLFATGAVAFYHGQNLFSYEGERVEASMARPVAARHRVGGKLLFLEVGVLACFLLPLPALLLAQSPFLVVHTTFFLYNLGVVAPAIVAGATFNRKALAVQETTFAQANVSGARTALLLPLLALPFLFLFAFDRLALQFAPIAAIGTLSLLARPLWLRGLAALYEWNRHAMARGFRASQD